MLYFCFTFVHVHVYEECLFVFFYLLLLKKIILFWNVTTIIFIFKDSSWRGIGSKCKYSIPVSHYGFERIRIKKKGKNQNLRLHAVATSANSHFVWNCCKLRSMVLKCWWNVIQIPSHSLTTALVLWIPISCCPLQI